jgi:GNAT superfamily N-acetyltransferase
MRAIRPITRQQILEGIDGHPFAEEEWKLVWGDPPPGRLIPCNMFGIEKRKYRCNMWAEVFNEVGEIGFLAYEDDKLVGQMIFLPKKYARRIGLPTSRTNDNLENTIVIGCLVVVRDHWNKGIASVMIKELMRFCKDHGFHRIESLVDRRPPDKAEGNTSFSPFRKFGFIIDEMSQGWESRPETRMCFYYI